MKCPKVEVGGRRLAAVGLEGGGGGLRQETEKVCLKSADVAEAPCGGYRTSAPVLISLCQGLLPRFRQFASAQRRFVMRQL